MKWQHIIGSKHGSSLRYRGRKYPLSRFEGGGWAVYRGAEVYVTGYHADDRGAYALLMHPDNPYLGRVVSRSELVPL